MSRNRLGALLGGFFGMLAFGYFSAVGLLIGCILGSIVGYRFDIVLRLGSLNAQDAFRFVGQPASRALPFVHKLGREICRALGFYWENHWHPAIQARFLRKIAAFLFSITTLMLLVAFDVTIWDWNFPTPVAVMILLGQGLWGVAALFGILLFAYYANWEGHISTSDMKAQNEGRVFSWEMETAMDRVTRIRTRRYYRQLELYGRGAFRYLLRTFVGLYGAQLVVIVAGSFVGVWLVTWVAYLMIIAAPVAVFYGAIKGVYAAACKGGFWTCLGVTTMVTVFVAWFSAPYIANDYMLWAMALGNGVLSAAVIELALRIVASSVRGYAWMHMAVQVPLKQRLKTVNDAFLGASDRVANEFTRRFVPEQMA